MGSSLPPSESVNGHNNPISEGTNVTRNNRGQWVRELQVTLIPSFLSSDRYFVLKETINNVNSMNTYTRKNNQLWWTQWNDWLHVKLMWFFFNIKDDKDAQICIYFWNHLVGSASLPRKSESGHNPFHPFTRDKCNYATPLYPWNLSRSTPLYPWNLSWSKKLIINNFSTWTCRSVPQQ